MNNNTFYIGTRADWSLMNKEVSRSVSKLNERLSTDLRSIAMGKGIKKTEQGQKLLFFNVSQDELSILMANPSVRPLLKVDAELMSKAIQNVNSSFPSRMTPDIFSKYQKELKSSMVNCVEVIGTDTNVRANPTKIVGENPYKVGDWIDTSNQYCYHGTGITNAIRKLRKEMFGYNGAIISDACRVYRVSKSSYWIEVPILKEEPTGVSNCEWANARFDNLIIAKGCNPNNPNSNNSWNRDHDWTIPYEGNEEAMEFVKAKTPIRISQSDISYPNLTEFKGYRSEYTERD